MPWLLWRSILLDLVRTLVVTAAVLVAVTAFGATIKPLADNSLLSAGQILKYLMLVSVPMLQFALPFSAGFAATLVFNRMTVENEIQAMCASGISYRQILAPVLAMGGGLLVLMLVLTLYVIPLFWSGIVRTVTADVSQLFQASIERGTAFEIGDLQIYADRIRVVSHPEGTDADTRLQLWKVAAAKLDGEGRIIADFTATQAAVDLYRRPSGLYLNLALDDPMTFDRRKGEFARLGEVRTQYGIPTRIDDDIDAMTRGQLKRLAKTPSRSRDVYVEMEGMADVLFGLDTREAVERRLAEAGEVRLVDSEGTVIRVEAVQLTARGFRARGPIVVKKIEDGTVRWTARAATAELLPADVGLYGAHRFTLKMNELTLERADDGRSVPRATLEQPGLSVENVAPMDIDSMTAEDVLARGLAIEDPSATLREANRRLDKEIRKLGRVIHGNLLERYGAAASAPLVLILGSVLAIWRRESLPLTIYVWAFLPTLIAHVVMSPGRHLIRDGLVHTGEFVLWSGVAGLTAMMFFVYSRLRRN